MALSCLSGRLKMWSTDTRLICVHIEPAQPTPSTAPPLPCETHPAQRPPVGESDARDPAHYICTRYILFFVGHLERMFHFAPQSSFWLLCLFLSTSRTANKRDIHPFQRNAKQLDLTRPETLPHRATPHHDRPFVLNYTQQPPP